jgi:hypothetical protein
MWRPKVVYDPSQPRCAHRPRVLTCGLGCVIAECGSLVKGRTCVVMSGLSVRTVSGLVHFSGSTGLMASQSEKWVLGRGRRPPSTVMSTFSL